MFVSSLLLRHLQAVSTNGLEIAEYILKNNDITKFDIIPVGGAIFPTMSFSNHSCYPNALRIGYQNHQVVRVIRRIPAGAEVNIDYGFDFYATPIEYREKRAATNYHFRSVLSLSLVEMVHSVAPPALLCHKEPAQGTQSPLLRAL